MYSIVGSRSIVEVVALCLFVPYAYLFVAYGHPGLYWVAVVAYVYIVIEAVTVYDKIRFRREFKYELEKILT